MVDYNLVGGAVWILCGLVILYLGFLIGVRGRADLHANYDEDVDPAYVSRWAGSIALLMGILVVGFGVSQALYGFEPYALGGLVAALLVLSYLSKLVARGWPVQRSR